MPKLIRTARHLEGQASMPRIASFLIAIAADFAVPVFLAPSTSGAANIADTTGPGQVVNDLGWG
ncbi:hypothetical protein [Streptomyces sp. NBC_01264]|uniref:hypothetical protein n=1 Tax=Streptomyces sp. NBC_01264 TaxID=2903804 RepID=UPI002259B498|nr:hypothetical protein [Streptomyces sp. NBC_01264]